MSDEISDHYGQILDEMAYHHYRNWLAVCEAMGIPCMAGVDVDHNSAEVVRVYQEIKIRCEKAELELDELRDTDAMRSTGKMQARMEAMEKVVEESRKLGGHSIQCDYSYRSCLRCDCDEGRGAVEKAISILDEEEKRG